MIRKRILVLTLVFFFGVACDRLFSSIGNFAGPSGGSSGGGSSSWHFFISPQENGFVKITPPNISGWINGLVETGSSCVQQQGLLARDDSSKLPCGSIAIGLSSRGMSANISYRVEVYPNLPFRLIGLTNPYDFPGSWKKYCWDAKQAWIRPGGDTFIPTTPLACGTLPTNNQPTGGKIVGLFGKGATFAELSDGTCTVRRSWHGFTGDVNLFVNEINDNTIEPGWWVDDANLLAGGSQVVPARTYTATEEITVACK